MARILLVEDDQTLARVLKDILEDVGHKVSHVSDGQSVFKYLQDELPDLVLLDMKLPDMTGIQILEKIKKVEESIQVIILTAYADVKTAVRAMKLGVFDYLSKPFDSEELILVIQKALQSQKIGREMEALRQQLIEKSSQSQIIVGQSAAMKQLLSQIKEVATTNLTVVLQGESGTGKEVLAHLIHQNSLRRDKTFIAVDCGALPETLVESELFGYERGAFTGADRRKLGQFELANEGTIFLDEIANLTFATQAKLLRVLQEKQIQRLGGKKVIDVDVRVIVATNVILEDAVKKKFFREDLYYRLAEFVLSVPSLRERKEDIELFAQHFLEEANKEFYKKTVFSKVALDSLHNYNWPGNIRELRNVVKRAVLLAGSEILPQHLQISVRIPTSLDKWSSEKRTTLKDAGKYAIEEVERKMIEEVLRETNYNKVKTAQILGISRRALYNKIELFGIKI